MLLSKPTCNSVVRNRDKGPTGAQNQSRRDFRRYSRNLRSPCFSSMCLITYQRTQNLAQLHMWWTCTTKCQETSDMRWRRSGSGLVTTRKQEISSGNSCDATISTVSVTSTRRRSPVVPNCARILCFGTTGQDPRHCSHCCSVQACFDPSRRASSHSDAREE